MDIQLFPEEIKPVSLKLKCIVRIAVLISMPLNFFSPGKIEQLFLHMADNCALANREEIDKIRNAVCVVSKKCRNQDGCLKRSLAVVIAARIKKKSVSWCTGYAKNPFRAHAWVEVDNQPVGELEEVNEYVKVICVPKESKVRIG